MATTSGFGYYKKTKIWKMINDYWKGGFSSCRLLNFSDKEVKYFICDTNIETLPIKRIETLTQFNPYLLSYLSVYGAGPESDFFPFADSFLTKFANDIVTDVKQYTGLPKFCEEALEGFYNWGCKADTGRLNDLSTLSEFRKSWGAKEQILYFKKFETNGFYVMSALPCVQMLLREITNELLHCDSIPDVPMIHGFLYKQKFFNMMKTQVTISVSNLKQTKTVSFSNICDVEMIEELSLGTLYHLKYTYPIIDGVGYLEVDGHPSLVFVQVSLTPYTNHSTKIKDLNTTTAPEDNSQTILQHCTGIIRKSSVSKIYVYVTPPLAMPPPRKKIKQDLHS